MFTFTCEKCGGQFYSKVDPSGWRHRVCNACSGKPYKDIPVEGGATSPTYQTKPVPTARGFGVASNNVAPVSVPKKEFNLEEYIADMLVIYGTLKTMCDEARYTIPEDCICSWTTSIIIEKNKRGA